jgi:putative sigma-54 modulation protein
MKIQIREHDVSVTDVQRAHVERRLAFALGRFGERIGRVTVRFLDVGHHGCKDKLCQIQVALNARLVRIEDVDADALTAFDHASARASRSVARALERDREWDAGPFRPWTSG